MTTTREVCGAPTTFGPVVVDHLPEPARRWLCHAITPGTPLARSAELRMHGEIRLGRRWHAFTADQRLTPDTGFVWSARTRLGGLPLIGYDRYADRVGAMHWRLLGLPFIRKNGGDVSLSALDRLAAESVLVPASLVDADWWHADEPDAATYGHQVGRRRARAPVTIFVAGDGRLRSIAMQRWANPDGRRYEIQPFTVCFDGEFDTGSVRVPDGIHASWPASGGEFFRASLDAVTLR